MKLVLGLYTQTSAALPPAVFKRAIGCIIKPVFTYVYNNKDVAISVSLSSAMIKYMAQNSPEMNLLISTLAKNGRVELFTSAYNQTILPIMQVKDRALIIDKNTTLIRRTYGVRATTLWCYGEIWSPTLVSTMKTVALDRLVISSYNAISKTVNTFSPFRMNELGKRIDVIPSLDSASRLVSMYGQNEISFEKLLSEMVKMIRDASDQDELVLMINLDQLCQGASYNREDDENLHSLFTSIFEEALKRGAEIALPNDITVSNVGYLEYGWYGRDAFAVSLRSFPEILVRDGNLRYYLNRVNNLSDQLSECKKDRVIKKSISDKLSTIPSGTLFLCDTNASNLRLSEHRYFYETLLDCEYTYYDSTGRILASDLDDDGVDELFCYGKTSSAVFAPRGASVHEFSSKEMHLNVFDTVSPWRKDSQRQEKKRSFVDTLCLNSNIFNLKDEIFDFECLGKTKSDYNFSLEKEQFQITKHYKMIGQNMCLSVSIYNTGEEDISGYFDTNVYFTLPGAFAFSYDQKRGPLMGESLKDIRNVRFSDSLRDVVLSFSSTSTFSVMEENRFQSEVTTLGSEQFYLYTKAVLRFMLDIKKDSVYTFNIITRIIDNKEKKNVFTQ